MADMNDMKDRIRQLMESQHMTQQNFAQALNMSPASLSSIFNDRTRPTLNHVEAIKNKFPTINIDWLLFGRGDMFLSGEDQPSPSSAPTSTAEELRLDFDGSTSRAPISYADSPARQSVVTPPSYRSMQELKIMDKQTRKVSSIQVIYDDSTIEIFVPKK